MQLPTPTLVDVRGPDGRVRPALLLASRGDRRFVQVNHAPGDNRLRWVVAGALREPTAAVGAAAGSAGRHQQALRPDPERSFLVGQHARGQAGAAW